MKAKAWLHSQGHVASAGRGRYPSKSMKDGRDINAILLEASKSGVKFSDWPKGKIEVKESETKAEATVTVVRDTTDNSSVAALRPYRFTEDEFKAVERGTKIERSMRSACQGCRCSLVVCYCPKPVIVARDGSRSVEVVISRK